MRTVDQVRVRIVDEVGKVEEEVGKEEVEEGEVGNEDEKKVCCVGQSGKVLIHLPSHRWYISKFLFL